MSAVDLNSLEHDSAEDVGEIEIGKTSRLPTPRPPKSDRGEAGPRSDERQQARGAAGMKDSEPWLRPENPAIWEGDIE